MEKKIKITEYDEHRNEFKASIGPTEITFDPFVGGILNGKYHDRKKIDSLIGKEFTVDVFQSLNGTWLLTTEGERQFKEAGGI